MKKIIFIISVAMLLVAPIKGYSKTVAYMFAKDQVLKLDTDTDSIMTSTKAPIPFEGYIGNFTEQGCVVDMNNKYLIAGYANGAENGFLNIYDLQTLNLLKSVTFPDIVKEPVNLRILYPQQGIKFYVEIDDLSLNNGQGGIVNLTYDKKTQAYLGIADNFLLDIDEKIWLSEDQAKIYVENQERNIRIYDSQTLKLLNTIDLSNIYATGLWSKTVKDIKNGVVLLKENKKAQSTDKNNFSFLTYKISDGTTTPRFSTGIDDKADLLTPDVKKLIINEAKATSSSGTKAPKKGPSATGRIHVYDVASGKKLGLVTLPTDFGEKMLAIRPQSDKLYYLKYSRDESKIRLLVIDLLKFRVIKEIMVSNLYFMVFYDE